MNLEPAPLGDDTEIIGFEAMINGRSMYVRVDREAIEDRLGRESMTEADRLKYVIQNRQQIIDNVARYVGDATDIDGIMVTANLLP